MANYFMRVVRQYQAWWRKPVTPKDRFWSAVIGLMGGFWLGLLGRLFLGAMPVSLSVLLIWGLGAAFLFMLLGAAFPKIVASALFPFAMMGPGGGS